MNNMSYYEQRVNKLDSLEEINKFLGTYSLCPQDWVKKKQKIWTDQSLEVKLSL